MALRPNAGQGLLIHEVSRSHTTQYIIHKLTSKYMNKGTKLDRYVIKLLDSSGRVIIPSHRPLPDNTQHSQETSMPPVGFEPRSQQASGRRPMP